MVDSFLSQYSGEFQKAGCVATPGSAPCCTRCTVNARGLAARTYHRTVPRIVPEVPEPPGLVARVAPPLGGIDGEEDGKLVQSLLLVAEDGAGEGLEVCDLPVGIDIGVVRAGLLDHRTGAVRH